jgi:UDP-N-acetylmuramate dehydrogenase
VLDVGLFGSRQSADRVGACGPPDEQWRSFPGAGRPTAQCRAGARIDVSNKLAVQSTAVNGRHLPKHRSAAASEKFKVLEFATRSTRLRGRLLPNARLAERTRLRVGGPASAVFVPADEAELSWFLSELDRSVQVVALGRGSNLLVRDGGFPGIVVALGSAFSEIAIVGDRMIVGGGCANERVADAALRAGLCGVEFLAGIPGTIGGSVRMNAGAFGSSMAAVVVCVSIVSRSGSAEVVNQERLQFDYRRCELPADCVVTRAVLQCQPDAPAVIAERMKSLEASRLAYQPGKGRTAGSTFRNPPGTHARLLIHAAGCAGLREGGASISQVNANFLFTDATATAQDVETLIEVVRRRVFEQSGTVLELELKIIGAAAPSLLAVR